MEATIEKSVFEPLFQLGADYKPVSLKDNSGYKVIIPDEIWTVDNVVNKEEAAQIIKSSEEVGYIDAQIGTEDGKCNC